MYNGYLMKIGTTTVPMNYIVFSSYTVKENKIVTNEYLDGSYNKHIDYAPVNSLSLKFNIRQTKDTEFPDISSLFAGDELTVEYFCPKDGVYRKGKFAMNGELNPVIDRIQNSTIWYKEISIELTRKVVVQ